MTIDTDAFSAQLRAAAVDTKSRRLLVTRFTDTAQEDDLSEPTNCNGHGRIRHFRRGTSAGWPDNPIPIDPASAALGLDSTDSLTAQVFQNAACNWRCWYCFVPFKLLNANESRSSWVTASTLVDWFAQVDPRPPVIDLSGGQPDLVPEWTAWMAAELIDRGLDGEVYLWVDDNLSNDYYWRYLSDSERASIASYRAHGRVGCFKGYDAESFAFNTGAAPELFDRQFELMRRHIDDGTDCYGYVTLTAGTEADPTDAMTVFVDRLQQIDEHLPLRVVPLEIAVWGPVAPRVRAAHTQALVHQAQAVAAWNREIASRFASSLRERAINEIPVLGR